MCESCRNGGEPLAAVWWRVSTEDQRERISPDTQVDAARTILEMQGYLVFPSRIIGTDWASLQLLDCPEFNTLIESAAAREIHAIAVYDRDRLPG